MTLTAAQAEIVRRFVAASDDSETWEVIYDCHDGLPGPAIIVLCKILRAALIEKDAEIERLRQSLHYHEFGDGKGLE